MMAGRLREVPVAVSKNRYLAGLRVLKDHDVDLFILDDGFQHHAIHRDLDIVVVDGLRRFGNCKQLPAGILREPLARLAEADHLIVTRAGSQDDEFADYLKFYNPCQVLWSSYSPAGLTHADTGMPLTETDVPEGPMVAFCGIAQPEGFRLTLEEAGIVPAELLIFPDHHPYSNADINRLNKSAEHHNAAGLVTTEKDAVRLPRGRVSMPVYSLAVKLTIDGAEDLVQNVLALVREPLEKG
jgi:tetraacyldisaccharide 4'-kinase